MSCPTCTDHAFCTVDRRCTGRMELDKCNWPKYTGESPYYTMDATGRVVAPYLTNFIKGVHGRNIEGFGFAGMSQTNAILVILLLVLLCFYICGNRK